MSSFKKTALLICAASMVICTAACDKSQSGSSSEQTTATSAGDVKASPEKVELKNYEFPEFLNDIKLPDMLSSAAYTSFDSSAFVQKIEEQPFEDYECTELINNLLYVYKQGKYEGILSLSGEVILAADTYADINLGSQGFLVLSRDKELNSPDDYARFDDVGRVTMDNDFSYDSDKISVVSRTVTPPDDVSTNAELSKTVYDLILPSGEVISDGGELGSWDSVEQVPMDSIDTTKVFNGYYKVTKDGKYYYIGIDRYYNYTIYNGAYGYVRLKVGSVYGECYIVNYDDYSELNKMINSFGNSSAVKSPSKEEGLDFIQIETGIGSEDKTVITISADGYCFTDNVTDNDQPMNKYFSRLDKESFVSLVQWVDQVLSKEYAGK